MKIGRLSELQSPHRNKDDVDLTGGDGSLFLCLECRLIGLGHAVVSDIEPVGLVFGVYLCDEEKEDEPTLGLRMRNFLIWMVCFEARYIGQTFILKLIL